MEKLIVSSSPHFNGGRTTQNIMLDVIIAPGACHGGLGDSVRLSGGGGHPHLCGHLRPSANTCAAG